MFVCTCMFVDSSGQHSIHSLCICHCTFCSYRTTCWVESLWKWFHHFFSISPHQVRILPLHLPSFMFCNIAILVYIFGVCFSNIMIECSFDIHVFYMIFVYWAIWCYDAILCVTLYHDWINLFAGSYIMVRKRIHNSSKLYSTLRMDMTS